MNLDFGSAEYAGRRLRSWLAYKLERLEMSPQELAEDLGYARATTVEQWLKGEAKIPLRILPKLASEVVADPATLIALFLDQELSDEPALREELFSIAVRVVPEWEFALNLAARLVYVSGEESLYTWLPDYAA